ncbi:MAG: hypothetical protein ACXQTE_00660 [Methanosarcinaceae archaeon]
MILHSLAISLVCLQCIVITDWIEPHEENITLESSTLVLTDHDIRYPCFGPDSERIVYSSTEDGGSFFDLWMISFDSYGGKFQLTSGDTDQNHPCFSPDGDKIYFSDRHFKYVGDQKMLDHSSISCYEFGSGNYTEVIQNHSNASNPDIDNDGERMVFISNELGPFTLWIYYFANGTTYQLFDSTLFSSGWVRDPVFNEKGDRVYFNVYNIQCLSPVYQTFTGDIWYYSFENQSLNQVTDDVWHQGHPTSILNDTYLLMETGTDPSKEINCSSIDIMNIESGKRQTLYTINMWLDTPELSPDNSSIVCVVDNGNMTCSLLLLTFTDGKSSDGVGTDGDGFEYSDIFDSKSSPIILLTLIISLFLSIIIVFYHIIHNVRSKREKNE